MKTIRLQQGDSFSMNFIIKENGVPTNIRPNEDLVIGFYDEFGDGNIIKLSNKQIVPQAKKPGYYVAFISHDITKNFIGLVNIEITIYDNSKKVVSHADKIIEMYFNERQNNYNI